MLFRRRNQLSFSERLRHSVWPSSGWWRRLRYFVKRVLRLSGSPHAVALGFAVGMFVAWSPFIGFHYLICIALCLLVRGNVLAALVSTTLENPLTLPAVVAIDYAVGDFILGLNPESAPLSAPDVPDSLWHKSFELLWPLLVGSVPVGLVTGTISYFLVRSAVAAYQEGRRHRLARRRLEIAASSRNA